MTRYFAAALMFLICLVVPGCQSYNKGLQEGSARVDETVVVSTFGSIRSAQQAYNLSHDSFGTFPQLAEGGYLDSRYNTDQPVMKGYVLTMTVTRGSEGSYACNANPARETSGRYFYIDSTSPAIHVNATQPATAQDDVLQP